MASSKAQDPLDALQSLVNDVLVQTGKALRASRRDSQGNLPPTHMQVKLPDTIKAFHSALDTLENDIIRAKSVLLRDLDQLKTRNNPAQGSQLLAQPQPVESQSKSPMAVEIDSSPPAILKEEPADNAIKANKPAAPFPDMGIGMGMSDTATSITIKEENTLPLLPPTTEAEDTSKVKPQEKQQQIHAAPIPMMDAKLENTSSGFRGRDDVLDLTNSDLNFTDMEFTLAPGNENPTQSGGVGVVGANTNGQSFDLGAFDTTDGATGPMSLDNSMPTNTAEQPSATASGTITENQPNVEGQKKEDGADPVFADIFTGDGQADGMDFDFSIGDGMGGDTFDDLMNDRDNTFDTMEHGDFDANFFGLNKVDEA